MQPLGLIAVMLIQADWRRWLFNNFRHVCVCERNRYKDKISLSLIFKHMFGKIHRFMGKYTFIVASNALRHI